MFKLTTIKAGTLLAFGALTAAPAMAQTAAQRVEITGSNIKRTTLETASPVQRISREEM